MENEARKYWFTALLFALSALICLWLGIFFIVQPPKESVMLSGSSVGATQNAERTVSNWQNSKDMTGAIAYLFGENGAPGLGSKPNESDDPAGYAIWQSIQGAELYGQILVYNVTVSSNNTNYGTVTGSGTYSKGSSVTITASPKTGYSFTQWSDGDKSTERTFPVASDVSLTATFTPIQYKITVTAGTGGTVSGDGTYDYGTSVTIKATASTGYTFTKWDDGNTNASRTFTVAGAATYTATFTANTYTISYAMNSGTHNGSWDTSYTFSTSSQTKSIGTASMSGYTGSVATTKGSISGSTLTIPANTTGDITVTWTWTQTAAILSLTTLGSGPLSGYKYFTSNGYKWVIIGYYGVTNYSLPNAVSNSEIGSGNVLCLSEKILIDYISWGSSGSACAISPSLTTYVGSDIRPYVQKLQLNTNKAGTTTVTNNSPANNGLFLLAGDYGNFKVGTYLTTKAKRVAYSSSGSAMQWWLRSAPGSFNNANYVSKSGDLTYNLYSKSYGARPAMVLKVQ